MSIVKALKRKRNNPPGEALPSLEEISEESDVEKCADAEAYQKLLQTLQIKPHMSAHGSDLEEKEEDDDSSGYGDVEENLRKSALTGKERRNEEKKLRRSREDDSEPDDNGSDGERIEDYEDEVTKIATVDDEEYEGPPKISEDLFTIRLQSVVTDAEASFLLQKIPVLKRVKHPDYKAVFGSGDFESSCSTLPPVRSNLEEYGICRRVRDAWKHMHEISSQQCMDGDFVSKKQNALCALFTSYQDCYMPNRPYPHSYKDLDPTLDACVVHCVNHVIRSLNVHKANMSRIVALKKSGSVVEDSNFRDRGFTCPKVLFLVPMRSVAYRVLERIIKLGADFQGSHTVKGMEKLMEDFAPDDKLEEATKQKGKPDDFYGIFGGNVSDTFRVGVQFSREGLGCFTNFYRSDIVVASPLSLSMMLKDKGLDFLSSIDILVMDRADVLAMQNWQHLVSIVKIINRIPKAQNEVNIMRVREHFLKDQAKLYRQTIILSSFATPEMNSLFASCRNLLGQIRFKEVHEGVMSKMLHRVRHVFERHHVETISSLAEDRLAAFKATMIPKMRTFLDSGTLIFVPHYFDHVRLRKLFRSEDIDICWSTEYSTDKHDRKCRSSFFKGDHRAMIITERCYFYRRQRIGGIKNIIFYGLPLHAHYYSELVNMMDRTSTGMQKTVTSIFSKYSILELERIIGSATAKKMLKGRLPTYMIY